MIAISVVIPVYNSAEYIARAIESALAQTLTQIEIICVDDESTDRSAEIIKRYQETDSRVIYIYQKNGGPGIARNTGLSHASGEFISFLDSDDEYADSRSLELLYNMAKSQNVYVCGGSVCGNWVPGENDILIFKEGLYSFIDCQQDSMFWRYIYQRVFLVENEISFPEFRDYEDPVFLLEVMDKAQFFYAVEDSVYKKNEGHFSQNKKSLQQIKHRCLGYETNIKLALAKKYRVIYYINLKSLITFARQVVKSFDTKIDNELLGYMLRGISLIRISKIPNSHRKSVLRELGSLMLHLFKRLLNPITSRLSFKRES